MLEGSPGRKKVADHVVLRDRVKRKAELSSVLLERFLERDHDDDDDPDRALVKLSCSIHSRMTAPSAGLVGSSL